MIARLGLTVALCSSGLIALIAYLAGRPLDGLGAAIVVASCGLGAAAVWWRGLV